MRDRAAAAGYGEGVRLSQPRGRTGIANAILTPAIYEQFKRVVVYEKFVLIEGELQNQENVISVKVRAIHRLEISAADVRSHDFH